MAIAASTKSPKTKCKTSTKGDKSTTLDLFNGEKYPSIPLASIEVVERPKGEEQKIFFNPRESASFDPVKMESLLHSIRVDGLIEPVVVAVFTGSKEKIESINLIAGERRFRSLSKLVRDNLPCCDSSLIPPKKYRANTVVCHDDRFAQVVKQTVAGVEILYFDENEKPTTESAVVAHEDLCPTAPAKKVFATVNVKVYYNPNEERMMRIAVTENKESEDLTTNEEVAACERLAACGCKQEKIGYMLVQNITWVSQTLSFRHQLPPDCFKALMDGRMRRNVAVKFLSYAEKDRQKLFEESVVAEEKDTESRIQQHRSDQEQHEDDAEMHKSEAASAEKSGDEKKAKQAGKKAASAETKANKAAERRQRAEGEKGTIKQGHVSKAATASGVAPRKAKMLSRDDIESCYIRQLEALLDGETQDPICDEAIPGYVIDIIQRTAAAIVSGELDALVVVRAHMVAQEEWSIPDGDTMVEEDESGEGEELYEPFEDELDEAADAFGGLDDENYEDYDVEEQLADMGIEDED